MFRKMRRFKQQISDAEYLEKELLDEYVDSIEVHPGNEVRISWK